MLACYAMLCILLIQKEIKYGSWNNHAGELYFFKKTLIKYEDPEHQNDFWTLLISYTV